MLSRLHLYRTCSLLVWMLFLSLSHAKEDPEGKPLRYHDLIIGLANDEFTASKNDISQSHNHETSPLWLHGRDCDIKMPSIAHSQTSDTTLVSSWWFSGCQWEGSLSNFPGCRTHWLSQAIHGLCLIIVDQVKGECIFVENTNGGVSSKFLVPIHVYERKCWRCKPIPHRHQGVATLPPYPQ